MLEKYKQISKWPRLSETLKTVAVYPEDKNYKALAANLYKIGTPQLIIQAQNESQVKETVKYVNGLRQSTGQKIPFAIKSGGHSLSSVNDGGVILDLGKLNQIQVVDETKGLVKIGPGAIFSEISKALAPYNLVLTSGDTPDVAAGGLATSGGIGYFSRLFGLTIDHLKGARLITADGSLHLVDDHHFPDLFWAIRGGNSQVGIVTQFLFAAQKLVGKGKGKAKKAPVIFQNINYQTQDLPDFIFKWGKWIKSAPRHLTSFLYIFMGHPDKKNVGNFANETQKTLSYPLSVMALNCWAGDDQKKAAPYFSAALKIASVQKSSPQILMSYADLVSGPKTVHFGQNKNFFRGALVDSADKKLGQAIEQSLRNPATSMIQIRSIDGAVSDVDSMETAFPARSQDATVWFMGDVSMPKAGQEAYQPIENISDFEYSASNHDEHPSTISRLWPKDTGQKLAQIVKKADPQGLFDAGPVLSKNQDFQKTSS